MKKPVKIAITGAGGKIGYSLIFRIVSGGLLGHDQPVILQLVETPMAKQRLRALNMEIEDCASALVHGVENCFDLDQAFCDCDFVVMVGAKPRKKGMERKDLLGLNGEAFRAQGRALNRNAKSTVKVLVVGNPANTNALVAAANAVDLSPECFSCLTRLDHNRARALLARKLSCATSDIMRLSVWGNHSSTQFPDLSCGRAKEQAIVDLVSDDWRYKDFVKQVQQRGARIIEASGASSVASAAHAIIEHMQIWIRGSAANDWTSMGILSNGEYGVDAGLFSSFPTTVDGDGQVRVVKSIQLQHQARALIDKSIAELKKERDEVRHLLP